MKRLFDLKQWGLIITLLFAGKIFVLTTATWLDALVLAFGIAIVLKGIELEEAPKHALGLEMSRLNASFREHQSLANTQLAGLENQMAELKKVSEEAKKLMSQTNIANAFVPRRKMGDG